MSLAELQAVADAVPLHGAEELEAAHAWFQSHEGGEWPAWSQSPPDARSEEDWEEAGRYVEECAPFLALLQRATAARPGGVPVDWTQGEEAVLVTMPLAQEAATVLQARALCDARRGDARAAIASLVLIVDVGDCQARFHTLPYRVRLTMYAIAAEYLEKVVRLSTAPFPVVAAHEALDGRLAAVEDPQLLADAFRGERALGLSILDRLARGEMGELSPFDAWFARPQVYQDGCRFLDRVGRLVALAPHPYAEVRAELADARGEDEESSYALTSLFASVGESVFLMRARYVAETRIARLGLVALAIRQETGAWPADVAAIEARLPLRDPLTGGSFRFEIVDGTARLFSAARDEAEEDAVDLLWEIR